MKPKFEEMRDVDVCVYYKNTMDPEAWAYIVRKYNAVIRKLAKQMLIQTKTVTRSLEWDDCYMEATIQVQKAMLYVNPAKISLPYEMMDKAVSTYINSYCTAWIKNQWNSAFSRKQGFIRDEKNQPVSPEVSVDEISLNINQKIEDEVQDNFVEAFKASLIGTEVFVYEMLSLGYKPIEIRRKLRINPRGYKAVFDSIHSKFNALKKEFRLKQQIIAA